MAISKTTMISILAAGRATRFGGGKLDADCAGQPLGYWSLRAARSSGPATIVIVTSSDMPRFAAAAEQRGDAVLVCNADAALGMGTSVACAARHAIAAAADILVVMLADMPLVSDTIIQALIASSAGLHIAAVRHPDGRFGVPAAFPSTSFDALTRLVGDQGASTILQTAHVIHVAAGRNELIDVDSQERLVEAIRLLTT